MAFAACLRWACLLWPSPASAQGKAAKPSRRPLILVPGLLGSRLCRPDPKIRKQTQVVWGTLRALRAISDDPGVARRRRKDDPIMPCGILREIVYLGLYTPERLRARSSGIWSRPDIARTATCSYSITTGADRSSTTPWRSKRSCKTRCRTARSISSRIRSVRWWRASMSCRRRLGARGAAVQRRRAVPGLGEGLPDGARKGWGALNPVMGGLDGFRRTILSFPSVFELMPRYVRCCDPAGNALDPARAEVLEDVATGRASSPTPCRIWRKPSNASAVSKRW